MVAVDEICHQSREVAVFSTSSEVAVAEVTAVNTNHQARCCIVWALHGAGSVVHTVSAQGGEAVLFIQSLHREGCVHTVTAQGRLCIHSHCTGKAVLSIQSLHRERCCQFPQHTV